MLEVPTEATRVGAEAQAEMLTDADLVAIGMAHTTTLVAMETTTAGVDVLALVLDPQATDITDNRVTIVMVDTATTTVDAATTIAVEAEVAVQEEARRAEMAHLH